MKAVLSTLTLALLATSVSAAESGEAIFQRTCATCHMPTGEGIPGVFPPLKRSDFFKSADPVFLVKLLQNGFTGELKVNGSAYVSTMPPQDLNDEQISAVLNYVSTKFVGGKNFLTPALVKKYKAEK